MSGETDGTRGAGAADSTPVEPDAAAPGGEAREHPTNVELLEEVERGLLSVLARLDAGLLLCEKLQAEQRALFARLHEVGGNGPGLERGQGAAGAPEGTAAVPSRTTRPPGRRRSS